MLTQTIQAAGRDTEHRPDSARVMLRRVAVVGAGPAGLCAARHILSRPDGFAPPVVFELSDKVGGTWCYDERVGTYDSGWPVLGSMYRNLRYVGATGPAGPVVQTLGDVTY